MEYNVMDTTDFVYEVLAIYKIPALLHDKKRIAAVGSPRVLSTTKPIPNIGDEAVAEIGESTIQEVGIGDL